MRVISGNFKGKRILEPKDIKTRPLKDLTKESIFNIIKHSNKFKLSIENSVVLDLFSGVGSFGLECISRGAKHVTFVENYEGVLPILKKNLINTSDRESYEIIEKNIIDGITFKEKTRKFDIIFLDPPFKDKNLRKILLNIFNEKITFKNTIFIIHRHKKEKDQYPENFKILDEKSYGISKVVFGALN
tara:strand:+ start:366 stop:929 length:564 start_codon:yes stop_codon:yes gene_type:complete